MVSDMHQNMLKGSEDTGGKGEAVSVIRTLAISEHSVTLA